MTKIFFLISIYLISPTITLAEGIGISRQNKPANIPLDISIGNLITNIIQIMFIIGGLGALVFMIWGSLDWILAGGDKEKLSAARKKIMNSFIGLALLALSIFIVTLLGEVIGIDILNMRYLPTLYDNPNIRTLPLVQPPLDSQT